MKGECKQWLYQFNQYQQNKQFTFHIKYLNTRKDHDALRWKSSLRLGKRHGNVTGVKLVNRIPTLPGC